MSLDYFGPNTLNTDDERIVRSALLAGLWCWPHSGEPLSRALAVVPDGPPLLSPGDVLLIADAAASTSLLSFRPCRLGVDSFGDVEFTRDSHDAWANAVYAARHYMPLVWQPLRDEEKRILLGTRLFWQQREARDSWVGMVTGPSFGLSFVLSIASLLSGIPVPPEIAATGEVNHNGSVGSVGAIDNKIKAIHIWAPRVSTVLVSRDDRDRARHAARGTRLKIVSVSSTRSAVRRVFGQRINEEFSRAMTDSAGRRAVAARMMGMALGGDSKEPWGPVRRTAVRARQLCRDAGADDEEVWFAWVAAIAGRHYNNRSIMPLLRPKRLERLEEKFRLGILAQGAQSAADTGSPDPVRFADLLQQFADVRNPLPHHLGLRGARARILAVIGRTHDAMTIQRDVARAFVDVGEVKSASRNLCEWYRLAGALNIPSQFDEAAALDRQMDDLGRRDPQSSAFIDLNRGRAAVHLGDFGAENEALLRSVFERPRLERYVQLSAARWLIQLLDRTNRSADAERIVGQIQADAAGGPYRDDGGRYRSLVRLDRAVREGDQAAAGQNVDELRRYEPGLVRLLSASDGEPSFIPEYIARFFPY